MNRLYAITGLDPSSDEYAALHARVDIIRPEDLDTWVASNARVLLRYPALFNQLSDFRVVPSTDDRIAISKENSRLHDAHPHIMPSVGRYRFFMTDNAYFATSDVAGGLGDATGDATHNRAAWVVADYVDRHPTWSFWALDVAWVNVGRAICFADLAVVAVHDGATVTLGDTLPPDAFYQVLVTKLTGSCCR